MFKLFQSIFRGGEQPGRYPESLVEMAIERTLDGTDPRLRLLRGYQKRLRGPVIRAIDHVVALVDAIPDPVPAGSLEYAQDPRLAALFVSAEEMLACFARDRALVELLANPEADAREGITALLAAQRRERNILGLDLMGDQVRREVAQVAVSFTGHRLVDPQGSEAKARRLLKRRAFDHLLGLALGRITELRMERADLSRQRDLLQRKLQTLEAGEWGFDRSPGGPADPRNLAVELESIEAQLEAMGADDEVLERHLGIVAEVLGEAERQLWAEEISLCLDAMNIERSPEDPTARQALFQELHNPRGQRAVILPISFHPGALPAREDWLAAASRYGY